MRVLTFSHDSYGLGHLRRTVNLARAITEADPNASVLCVSGSPTPSIFDLPAGVDLVKLPSFTKSESGGYVPRSLRVSAADGVSLRAEMIRTTARCFRPDLILVDHAPIGIGGELLPMLEEQRSLGRAWIALGMRDIVDEPTRARAELAREYTRYALSQLYHRVLVYGHSHVCDVGLEYGLGPEITHKLRYVGVACDRPETRRAPGSGVLATVGGGQDGLPLLRAVVDWLERQPARAPDTTLVTGPFLAADDRDDLALRAESLGATVFESTSHLTRLLDQSECVVGMGGYNTVYEALARRKRVVVVPRVFPRREQLDRARRLRSLGLLELVRPEDLHRAGALDGALRLDGWAPTVDPADVGLRFDGARVAAETLLREANGSELRLAS